MAQNPEDQALALPPGLPWPEDRHRPQLEARARDEAEQVATIEALVDRFLPAVQRIAHACSWHASGAGIDEGDVAQEVWSATVAAWNKGELPEPPRLTAWLWEVTRNAVRKALRKPRPLLFPDAEPDVLPSLKDSGLGPEAIEAILGVRAALSRLPPNQRQALCLRYLLGLSVSDVAHAMGEKLGSVRGLLDRGRATLRADRKLRALHLVAE